MNEIRIRPARPADAPAIQSVARDSWSDVYQDVISIEAQRRALEHWYSTNALIASIQSATSIFVVAETSRELLGFAQLNQLPDGSADLARIYVLPPNQRHGVGVALLRAVFDSARNNRVSRITVSVAKQNKRARSFYERSGFSLCGEGSVDLFGFSLQEVMYEQPVER